jgi:hypothetical protein
MADRPDDERNARVFAPATLTTASVHPLRWLVAAILVGGLVIAKPWGASTGASPTAPAIGSVTPAPLPAGSAAPSAMPSVDPEGIDGPVVETCLRPGIWLVATEERYGASSIRIWRAIDPIAVASGPGDPAIPVLPVISEGISALGWCAPTHGIDRPTVPATVETWRVVRGTIQAVALVPVAPVGGPSPFGALYGPPGPDAGVWPDGRLIVRYREGDGADRWFAISVQNRPEVIPSPPVPPSAAP